MARSTKEWIGKNDDTRVPDYVKVRVFVRYNGICQCGCGGRITGRAWALDHKDALINGGANRESNLQPILEGHHKSKTKEDVAIKSLTFRKRKTHYGIKKSKGRPIPGSKRSGLKKRMDGTVVKR